MSQLANLIALSVAGMGAWRMARAFAARRGAAVACGSCRFFTEGACKRFPPVRVYKPPVPEVHGGSDVTVWPLVRPELDWCGEHVRRGGA